LSHEAAIQFPYFHSLDKKPPFQLGESLSGLPRAGEDVHRGVGVLGPGVNGYVGLGEKHDGGDTVRRKGMGAHVDDGEPTAVRCGYESLSDAFRIVEDVGIGNPELCDQVLAQTSLGHLLVFLHPPKTVEEHLESLAGLR
jgi:hypothetical protein